MAQPPDSPSSPSPKALAIAEVRQADEDERAAKARVSDAVVKARKTGATWEEIAAVLGIRRQTAHHRYRDLDAVDHSE